MTCDAITANVVSIDYVDRKEKNTHVLPQNKYFLFKHKSMHGTSNVTMTSVRNYLLLSLWVVVILLSGGQGVKGAKCAKSIIGSLRCSPCSLGSRCVYCESCLGYCHNNPEKEATERKQKPNKNNANITYGTVEVPYKFPLLAMFKNIEAAIIADEISHLDVVEMYRVTSLALREDCEICNDSKELRKLKQLSSIHQFQSAAHVNIFSLQNYV